mgnify:CR=1 FL=1
MEIESIKTKIQREKYVYSSHADLERKADGLTFHEIEIALLNGEILEQYPGYWQRRKLFDCWVF